MPAIAGVPVKVACRPGWLNTLLAVTEPVGVRGMAETSNSMRHRQMGTALVNALGSGAPCARGALFDACMHATSMSSNARTCDGPSGVKDAHEHQLLAWGAHDREGWGSPLAQCKLGAAVEHEAACVGAVTQTGMCQCVYCCAHCCHCIAAGRRKHRARVYPPAVTVWLLTWAPLVKAPSPWTLPYRTSDAAFVKSANRGSARLILVGWLRGTRGEDAQKQLVAGEPEEMQQQAVRGQSENKAKQRSIFSSSPA